MLIDTTLCDNCQLSNICIRARAFKKIEDLISHAMVRSPNGSNYALSSYLADGDIAAALPLKIDCPTYLYTRK